MLGGEFATVAWREIPTRGSEFGVGLIVAIAVRARIMGQIQHRFPVEEPLRGPLAVHSVHSDYASAS
jgi:hypothetical protein